MSSILLRKDHDGKKAGTVISVPFGLGKVLIAQKIAEYFDADKHGASEVKIEQPKPEVLIPRDGRGREIKGIDPKMTMTNEGLKTPDDAPHSPSPSQPKPESTTPQQPQLGGGGDHGKKK